jgi:hypothetical protein
MAISIEVKDVQAVLPVSAAWNANIKVENSELVIYDDGPQKTLEMSNLRIATEKKDSSWARQKVVAANKERTLNIDTNNSKIAIDEAICEQGTVNITGELSKVLFYESQRAIEGNKND